MEILLILLVLLGLWGLFIWLCSRIGGWIGSTLYDVLHGGPMSQDAKKNDQDQWKTEINEATKKGERRS